jgi:hypothetical protein
MPSEVPPRILSAFPFQLFGVSVEPHPVYPLFLLLPPFGVNVVFDIGVHAPKNMPAIARKLQA